MANETPNYNLAKPLQEDFYDINVTNENMDIIDTALKGIEDSKVEKAAGKQLSTNDFTDAEKSKLSSIETGATNYIHPSNHPASMILQDANNRFCTDSEKGDWNGKADTTTYSTTISTAWLGATAPYTQSIALAGILESDTPTVDVVLSSVLETALLQEKAWNCISRIVTTNGSLTVSCNKKKPTTEIPIQLKVVR